MMKGPAELKRFIAKNKESLKGIRWDSLYVLKLQTTCKKWFKRNKKIDKTEWD